MAFNEDTRVKIPAILHLIKLGYEYISLKNSEWDVNTNIFDKIYLNAVTKLNPKKDEKEVLRELTDLKMTLENDDLGKEFYKRVIDQSDFKHIDLENFNNNHFNVITELKYKNGDDEFRPDITILVNGLPLVFIEVKKPNNPEGILAERERLDTRFKNKKFKRFINATQFMIFSNNMEYEDGSLEPLQGAFYATTSSDKAKFNYFREEIIDHENFIFDQIFEEQEDFVLNDNNLMSIKGSPEFSTNKSVKSPTNKILTSMLSKERLSLFIKFSIAYVKDRKGIKKHIMRYPQFFASLFLKKTLNEGIKKGIIWHTQGSGKTALAFYSVKFLTDYFRQKKIIPKFYFIVDRIDLLSQAQLEFSSRGLIVHIIESKEAFLKDIKSKKAVSNATGQLEITVINIQRFSEDNKEVHESDYNISVQRIYFLDEVHRSYNPKGSFLANLDESDRNAIKIGLTGTPLIGKEVNSKSLFGNYIHKYYYNSSIADGYTLRLIREEIESNYKRDLEKILWEIQVKQGEIEKKDLYAHKLFVSPMLEYIISDFEKSRGFLNDNSIGAMVICDSSDQAKEMYSQFIEKYGNSNSSETEKDVQKDSKRKVKTASLILHDIGSKKERKDWTEEFKSGSIDILFVYNMLQTGFDAERLKKIYLGRIVKKHNLLQTLTRVNRTYKNHKYGYVVDFADITSEFEKTNKAYFEELQSELGDDFTSYSNLFKTPEEILEEIENIKNVLFEFDIENAEIFSQQINQISDRKTIIDLKNALTNARELYNIIRMQGEYDLLSKLDFGKLNSLLKETSNHLDLINLNEKVSKSDESNNLLNIALENIIFKFTKIGQEELVIADQLKNILQRTREALVSNFDKKDPKFILLKDELDILFKKKNLSEVRQEEMNKNITSLETIFKKTKNLNNSNDRLSHKYDGDRKFARIHKRILENFNFGDNEINIFNQLKSIKNNIDESLVKNYQVIQNESYFEQMLMKYVLDSFQKDNNFNTDQIINLNSIIAKEYQNEFKTGDTHW